MEIQNGKVNKNEKEIALLKLRHKIEEKVETWSRKKLLFYGATVLAIMQVLIFFGFEFLRILMK